MSRFEKELSGALGTFWKKYAEQEIEKMRENIKNNEIRTDINGGAFWVSSGNYLPEECVEILSHTDFPFSPTETAKAREVQNAAFLECYRKNYTGPSEEEFVEMQAAFGKGTTVIDIISGKEINL